jgi:hypothetical protein
LYFQDHVGDLLMTHEAGVTDEDYDALFIWHWNPVAADFEVISTLAYPTDYVGIWPDFELGAFAPFPIPLISPQP